MASVSPSSCCNRPLALLLLIPVFTFAQNGQATEQAAVSSAYCYCLLELYISGPEEKDRRAGGN